jgi:rhodanese-related sulfurtransferase
MRMFSALGKLFAKPYKTITATDADSLMSGGAVLVDVRDRHEWQAGHAPKARNIPLTQLAVRHKELPPDRMVITVCRSGMRSAQAARLLAGQGLHVVNLSGGMLAWARAGLPVSGKAGPGRVI